MRTRIKLAIGAAALLVVAVLGLSYRAPAPLGDKRSGGASLPTSAPGPSVHRNPDVEAYPQPSQDVDPFPGSDPVGPGGPPPLRPGGPS